MNDSAVMVVAIGDEWQKILEISGPTIKSYAKRIGADYVVIRDQKFPTRIHAYEKLRVRDLLGTYGRVIVIDADCIVRSDTPSLLDLVPPSSFGAVIKPPYPESERMWIRKIYEDHAKALRMPVPDHGDRYFSSGVMVCSQRHIPIFSDPPVYAFAFYEQTYLNIRVAEERIPFFEIPYKYNCWNVRTKGADAYILHYARSCTRLPIEEYCATLQSRIEAWGKSPS